MKKIIAVIVAAVIIAAAVLFLGKSRLFNGSQNKNGSGSSEPTSQVSSENISSSVSQPSSLNESTAGDDETINKIKSAINVDWKKYRLSKGDKKTINGKTYLTFTMWDDDYQEGPLVLVDPDTGKVFTWVKSDSSPVPADKDKAFDKTVHTVNVTITDGAMMSYIGKTSDGNELTIPRYDVKMVNFSSIKIGDKIKIYYTGVITGNDTSRAFITKLEKIS